MFRRQATPAQLQFEKGSGNSVRSRHPLCARQLGSQEGVATIHDVFHDIAGQAEKMYKVGVPSEEAQRRYVVPDKFKSFPIFAWGFTIGPAITKPYSEWRAAEP